MAWTSFPTLTDGQALTGAHMQLVRDNFAETAPAKATAAAQLFVATGANAIAARTPAAAFVATAQSTSTTSYTDLTTVGPAVTVTTGTQAWVMLYAGEANSSAGANVWMSFAVSGASTVAGADNMSVGYDSPVATSTCYHGASFYVTSLTAGSNTFTAKYRVSSGTGTFSNRRIFVIPL